MVTWSTYEVTINDDATLFPMLKIKTPNYAHPPEIKDLEPEVALRRARDIAASLAAELGYPAMAVPAAYGNRVSRAPSKWIADTGSGCDLVSRRNIDDNRDAFIHTIESH